jgi:hypothetical protein
MELLEPNGLAPLWSGSSYAAICRMSRDFLTVQPARITTATTTRSMFAASA